MYSDNQTMLSDITVETVDTVCYLSILFVFVFILSCTLPVSMRCSHTVLGGNIFSYSRSCIIYLHCKKISITNFQLHFLSVFPANYFSDQKPYVDAVRQCF